MVILAVSLTLFIITLRYLFAKYVTYFAIASCLRQSAPPYCIRKCNSLLKIIVELLSYSQSPCNNWHWWVMFICIKTIYLKQIRLLTIWSTLELTAMSAFPLCCTEYAYSDFVHFQHLLAIFLDIIYLRRNRKISEFSTECWYNIICSIESCRTRTVCRFTGQLKYIEGSHWLQWLAGTRYIFGIHAEQCAQ